MNKRYFIQDFGLLNALGNNRDSVWANWQRGQAPGLECSDEFRPGRPCVLGRVTAELPAIANALAIYQSRNNQLLAACYQQIRPTVEALAGQFGTQRIGLVLGSSTSGIHRSEDAMQDWLRDGSHPPGYHFKQQEMGAGVDFLAALAGTAGPGITISTACSSSANAFATARRLLDLDLCDAVIVGGADSLCRMTVQGFSALESVSDSICQPFSANRCGITIGEAVALFVLGREPLGDALELYGVGCSSDAHHMSAPEPSGSGAVAAMQAALAQSPFAAGDISYLNLHGTATPLNDAMESRAVAQLFGPALPCSSSKSLTGHTLGAAAATELALCCLLLRGDGRLPAQVWDGVYDDTLPRIDIVSETRHLPALDLCMSNSFAFGGNNTSLIVGKAYETIQHRR
ncbi:MAG TPA: beta-ketoacyl-ACP synthase [Pseudomonadales bacterium]